MTNNDYSDLVDAPTVGDSQSLSRLIEQLAEAETRVAEAQEELKKRQATVRSLSEQEIPELMARMGVAKFETTSGLKVEVKDDVRAAIAVANRPDAFAWLQQNGHGGLIKREIAVAFAQSQGEAAKELRTTLEGEYPGNVKEEMWVEPQTLKAFVKRQLEAGTKIPVELFGIQKIKIAKVK